MEKPRQIAFKVLQLHAGGEEYVEDLLAEALERSTMAPNDRGLTHELVCGVVRWRRTLDWLIDDRTGGREQQQVVRELLRLALYQLFWLDRIPAHAAVHETVELAKGLQLGPVAGFVNAFLRKVCGELDPIRARLKELEVALPDLGLSHPSWIATRWTKAWGAERCVALMRWNNQPPLVFARLNTLKSDAATLEARWTKEGVQFVKRTYPWVRHADVYELQSHPPLTRLASFVDGAFYVQDPSTLLAVEALDPQPGETILDMCAAPGGKLCYMAQRMNNQGRLLAQDNQRSRLQLVDQNCRRLGVTGVRLSTSSTVSHPDLSLTVDRILLDAPCSNTGVMRRRVDLRWRINGGELARLTQQQAELLDDAALRLRPGGTLAYSTCSLEPEENQTLVDHFLRRNPSFKPLSQTQLSPFEHGVDGAFVAVMQRLR